MTTEPVVPERHWGVPYDEGKFCTDHDCWCHYQVRKEAMLQQRVDIVPLEDLWRKKNR